MLLRRDLIYPNIAINDLEVIFDVTELVKLVKHQLGNWHAQCGLLSASVDLSDIAMSGVFFS